MSFLESKLNGIQIDVTASFPFDVLVALLSFNSFLVHVLFNVFDCSVNHLSCDWGHQNHKAWFTVRNAFLLEVCQIVGSNDEVVTDTRDLLVELVKDAHVEFRGDFLGKLLELVKKHAVWMVREDKFQELLDLLAVFFLLVHVLNPVQLVDLLIFQKVI